MTSSVGATVARKAMRATTELQRAGPVAMSAASLAFKRTIEAEIRKAAPSGRLKGVGRKGARVGVRYDLKNGGNGLLKSFFKATGPLHLLERSTKAHRITPRSRGRGRSRSAGGGLVLPDGGVRRSVQHPGTKGKQPFEKGIEKGKDAALKTLRNAHTDAIKRGLKS